MRFRSARTLLIAAMLGIGYIALHVGSSISGQDQPNKLPDAERPGNSAAATCFGCHRGEEKENFRDAQDMILFNESKTWKESDYHQLAYQALSSPLGEKMNTLLPSDKSGRKLHVTKRSECLSCHAVDLYPHQRWYEPESFDTHEGVNCLACHSTEDRVAGQWRLTHMDPAIMREEERWRNKHPDTKALQGQRDLRDPKVRAQTCNNCHIGNLQQGKFVTHDMYAAGHPPLAGIEVMAYSRDQQMHYEFGKKLRHISEHKNAWELYHYRKDEDQAARQMAVGAIVSLRSTLSLIVDQSANLSVDNPILDYAQFDCYSCHHDLGGESWRQKARGEGKPGRVRPRLWSKPLARVVVQHAAEITKQTQLLGEFDAAYKDVLAAFDAHPLGVQLGEERPLRDKVLALDALCAAFLKVQEAEIYTKENVKVLKQMLAAEMASADRPDLVPDSAQQMVWAFGILNDDPAEWERTAAYKDLDKYMPLRVRPAKMELDSAGKPVPLAKYSQDRSRRCADYRPDELRRLMTPFSK